ncbi:MAG: hypothetical protein PWP24_1113 [Clostridiales bacterium]|nr:hypothetical protein [Clostridiales bacterium]
MRFGSCMDEFYGRGIPHGMSYFGGGSYLFFSLMVLAIIALLFVAFVHNRKKKNDLNHEAEEALKIRYVNGEITEEEYQRMKKIIRN